MKSIYFGKKKKLLNLQKILFIDSPEKLTFTEEKLYQIAQERASRYIDDINTYAQIINNTSEPHTFFNSFDDLFACCNHLIKLEPYISFSGSLPSESLKNIKDKEQASIADFLDRYLKYFINICSNNLSPEVKYQLFTEPLTSNYFRMSKENLDYINKHCKDVLSIKTVNRNELRRLLTNKEIDCDLLLKSVNLIIEHQSPYSSFLQRELNLSFLEASKIIEYLDKIKILEKNPDNTRKIMIKIEDTNSLELTLKRCDSMGGYEFEEFCCELLEKNNYTNVSQTKLSGDNGIDVLAEKEGIKYAIQCKCYSDKLGNKAVQEAYTGLKMYNCDIGVVMTNSYFTESAKNTAEQTRIRLWDRETLSNMINKTL